MAQEESKKMKVKLGTIEYILDLLKVLFHPLKNTDCAIGDKVVCLKPDRYLKGKVGRVVYDSCSNFKVDYFPVLRTDPFYHEGAYYPYEITQGNWEDPKWFKLYKPKKRK